MRAEAIRSRLLYLVVMRNLPQLALYGLANNSKTSYSIRTIVS
jgi:hypothetical protein